MNIKRLPSGERSFHATIRQAVFANPFSDSRAELDRLISGKAAGADEKETIARLIVAIESRLRTTFAAPPASVQDFQGEDRTLVEHTVLFLLFHRYCQEFDQHIQDQLKNGDEPCRVAFAGRLLGEMQAYGLNRRESVRYFSLFFQMRRAFYFINAIIGQSHSMKELRRALWNNIFTHDIEPYEQHLWNRMEDFSTMLLGGTGTGKGMAAAAIGRSGFIPFDEKRSRFAESFTRAFVSLNLSQYPEQLLESELFGHQKGAFTGAVENHDGVFSRCSQYGAIFLDEIGEVSVPVQIKLLQILQDRTFFPVGSHAKKRFHGRVIAATNRSLAELRHQGIFRDDFYYRLCSDIIVVPPLEQRLREHDGELGELLDRVISKIVGRPSAELLRNIISGINRCVPPTYSWPGNVRELEQCVRRILLREHYEGDSTLPAAAEPADVIADAFNNGRYTAQQLLGIYCAHLYRNFGTYEEVSRRTGLDRRTVKKHIGGNNTQPE